MFWWLIPTMVQAGVGAWQARQQARVASPWARFEQFAQSPWGMAALGLLAGRIFPNAFVAPGSGYEQALLGAMGGQLDQSRALQRMALSALARIPPAPSLGGLLEARAQAGAERAAERAVADLPAGVQLPGLRERVRGAAYAALREPSVELALREPSVAYEQALRHLQLLAGVGGQAADLAQQYGYLAQLHGQRGNLFYGALPQLLAGLWEWGLERKRR